MEKSRQGGLRILFADDESHLRDLMQMELPRLGHEVTVCPDGAAALKALEQGFYDAALLDLRMPGMTGIEVLGQIRQISPETQVIILTGHATVDTAVQALRLGAFDYLTKPCKWAELEMILNRVAERRDMANKTTALETRLKAAEGMPLLIGDTPAMQQVRRLIDTIAPTDASVMILGETGTGKELVARSLHDKSRRADRAFIPVNCGALPENLVESELFGHRKGAFTGADAHRKGLFEVANGGTLFLDEVGELDKSVQVKLLRFLESGEIRKVGENEPFRVDVRVLCATNRDLREMVANELFREDLFFRLNTFEIYLPPLRERRADIGALANHLLLRHAARRGLTESMITPASIAVLAAHEWPGNIRELANMIERSHDPGRQRPDSPGTPADPASHARSKPSIRGRVVDGGASFSDPRGHADTPRHRDEVHPDDPRETPRQQAGRVTRTGDQPENALQQDQSTSAQLRTKTAASGSQSGGGRFLCPTGVPDLWGWFSRPFNVSAARGPNRHAFGRAECRAYPRGPLGWLLVTTTFGVFTWLVSWCETSVTPCLRLDDGLALLGERGGTGRSREDRGAASGDHRHEDAAVHRVDARAAHAAIGGARGPDDGLRREHLVVVRLKLGDEVAAVDAVARGERPVEHAVQMVLGEVLHRGRSVRASRGS